MVDRYVRWLNDPMVNRFLEARFEPQTRQSVVAYVLSYYGAAEKYIWGIYETGNHQILGTATLSSINRRHGSAEIGLLVGERDYWGKGASDEALEMVIGFAFDDLGLRRLTGGTYAPNQGMNFTFMRYGFRREGTLQEACLLEDGVYVDVYRWGLLSKDWRMRDRHRS